MKPDEFWKLTPRELNLMAEGYTEEQERRLDLQQRLLAWHASNVMNVHTKKRIKPEDLYKPKDRSKSGNNVTKENRREYLNNLLRKFGKETLPESE